jgi:predicted CoA-substrate-specific enzyme activase
MRSAGIDIGSRAVKLIVAEDGLVVHRAVADTGSDPLAVCRRLLDGVAPDAITATGYGRHLFKEHWQAAEMVTEIKAVATGALALIPGCRTIIDIGGQDTKVIALDAAGRVQKFAMNDRCAAGTGQFLEMMATALGFTREEFIAAAGRAGRPQRLSSMCSVFAQSEVVSLIARGAAKDEMALGVHQSVASRAATLAGGVAVEAPVIFTGGCAHNRCLVPLLAAALKHSVRSPESPQTVAALGAALLGAAPRGDLAPPPPRTRPPLGRPSGGSS